MYQRLKKAFARFMRPLHNEWGRVGTGVDAEPDEGESTEGQGDPPCDGGESQSDGEPVDKYARFRGGDGTLDAERVLESYKELERDHGRLGNEVGQLRQARQQWYEQMQTQPDAANREEATDIIHEKWDENPMAVLDAYGRIVEDRLLNRMAQYSEVFSDPLLNEHPDVRNAAMQLSSKHGLDPEIAINIVLGQKVRNAASQATADSGGPIPSQSSVPSQRTSFIQPAGTPIQTGPGRSQLSDAQRNWIRKEGSKYGITSEEDYLKWKA